MMNGCLWEGNNNIGVLFGGFNPKTSGISLDFPTKHGEQTNSIFDEDTTPTDTA